MLDAPDITPTCHGTPNAGAGGHKMLMGDDREATAGLGLGDQDRGWSAEARQTEWGVRGGTAGHGGRKFYGEGAWQLPPGHSYERPESRLRHAAFRRRVRGPAPHPRRCACSDCACCDEEDKEERETAALHILEVPRLDAPDITPTCHGTPNAGAGGHKMLMGDDREAGATKC